MEQISASRQNFTGTAAERTALGTQSLQAKDTWIESDTGSEYIWDGDSWVEISTNGAAHVHNPNIGGYETVAASQTDQVIGATGAAGDFLHTICFSVTSTSAGKVTLKDNTTEIWSCPGTIGIGTYTVTFDIYSVNGAFKVSTQANTSACIVTGNFT